MDDVYMDDNVPDVNWMNSINVRCPVKQLVALPIQDSEVGHMLVWYCKSPETDHVKAIDVSIVGRDSTMLPPVAW